MVRKSGCQAAHGSPGCWLPASASVCLLTQNVSGTQMGATSGDTLRCTTESDHTWQVSKEAPVFRKHSCRAGLYAKLVQLGPAMLQACWQP